MQNIRFFFSFPEFVNEISARLVATGVLFMCIVALILVTQQSTLAIFITGVLVYGFMARASSGPKVSPLALLVTKIIVPRLGLSERIVPGPPKRFAQTIGLIVSSLALYSLIIGSNDFASALLLLLSFFAFLESVFGYCFGCKVFKFLIFAGLVPQDVCDRCVGYQY